MLKRAMGLTKRGILLWAVLGIAFCWIWSAFGFPFRKNIRVGLERKYWPPNVHSSPIPWIEVNGKTYKHLKGENPYHLGIGETGMVYFFTDSDGQACFHLISTNGGPEISIPYSGYYDGRGIGSRAEAMNHDWIESVDFPRIVIKSRSSLGPENVLRTLKFDIQKGSVDESSEYTAKE